MSAPFPSNVVRFTIGAECELRIELSPSSSLESSTAPDSSATSDGDADSSSSSSQLPPLYRLPQSQVSVCVLSGSVELFGVELPSSPHVSTPLPQSPTSVSLFSWFGAVVVLHPSSLPSSVRSRISLPASLPHLPYGGGPDGLPAPNSLPFDLPKGCDAYLAPSTDVIAERVAIANLHAHLDSQRDASRDRLLSSLSASASSSSASSASASSKSRLFGPRLLLLGAPTSGRLAVLKTLLSYALKCGRSPLVANLDPSRVGASSLPGGGCGSGGCVGLRSFAAVLDRRPPPNPDGSIPPSVVPPAGQNVAFSKSAGGTTSFSVAAMGGALGAKADGGLTYYYGSSSAGMNVPHYKSLLDRLAEKLDRRLTDSKTALAAALARGDLDPSPPSDFQLSADYAKTALSELTSGLLLLGPNVDKADDLELVLHAIRAFDVQSVLVVGSDKLHAQLSQKLKGASQSSSEGVKVVKVAKSGGVSASFAGAAARRQQSMVALRAYFYGEDVMAPPPAAPTSKFVTVDVDFATATFLTMSNTVLDQSLLPVGQKQVSGSVHLTKVEECGDLKKYLKQVLAVVPPGEAQPQDRPVLCFVVLLKIDEEKLKVKLGCPSTIKLTGKSFLIGNQERGVLTFSD